MAAYYNEIDPYAAAWLRTLIAAGHIAPGDVDERDIRDVRPDDLKPYTQCHFFAGIGVWSYALRRAAWPDDRPVWTGSCPCQPFSQAGAGAGFDDERHLWPDFHWLIRERQPPVVFGEQVASKDADPWVDLVQADLEAMGYAFGATPFPAAGIGAPNIRDRLYWMAYADRHGRQSWRQGLAAVGHRSAAQSDSGPGRLGDALGARLEERFRVGSLPGREGQPHAGQAVERAGIHPGGLAHAYGGLQSRGEPGRGAEDVPAEWGEGPEAATGHSGDRRPGPVNGFWRDADWLLCRDGKWRAVEPGTFPLADGAPARVGRLRAYGNAINAEAAIAFIQSAIPSLP